MTQSGTVQPSRQSQVSVVGLILLRWAILAFLGFAVHWFARVGPLAPGGNIEDLVQSTADRVLWAVALTLFVFVAVVWRETRPIPVVTAAVESLLLGVGALWPAVNDRLVLWVGDSGVFSYQSLFAIAFAGALLGLYGSIATRRGRVPGG